MAWNSLGSIKGPAGDTGPQGEQGTAGADGAAGPQGAQGAPGYVPVVTSYSQVPSPFDGMIVHNAATNMLARCVMVFGTPTWVEFQPTVVDQLKGRKSSDTSRSLSTSFLNESEFTLSIPAGSHWAISGFLLYAADAAVDIHWRLTLAGTNVDLRYHRVGTEPFNANGAPVSPNWNRADDNGAQNWMGGTGGGTANMLGVPVKGFCSNLDGGPRSFTMDWKPAASGTCTLYKNSYFVLTRLP